MNFFGHSVVASWHDDHAGHLLGSMLPDFETMMRVPLIEVRDPMVRRGIDLHHRTDEAFHRATVFTALCAEALADLTELGVRRGPARAVAHVGTELFLDGWLARRPAHVEAYLAALELDPRQRLDWQDGGVAFDALHARLSTWGAPIEYGKPDFVLRRISDSLRRRPALALRDEEPTRIASFLPTLRQRVELTAPELLARLRSALGCGS